ncbi:hypothetical protein I5R92_28220 [Pseudomonas carnis]|uniref:hypothetical protein n=1 Tax=Pseudomonas carnis TaxID=2487355 RepID=UPI0018D90140|nr:hypothetical protein [Pseudomonas carnis]MBH3371187.1 hypothetical protein [Pseudomonas carnis]
MYFAQRFIFGEGLAFIDFLQPHFHSKTVLRRISLPKRMSKYRSMCEFSPSADPTNGRNVVFHTLNSERLKFSVFMSRGARGAKPWRFLNGPAPP